MANISKYADGIAPKYTMLVDPTSTLGHVVTTEMIAEARRNSLAVHPYTFRKDPGQIPNYARDFTDYLRIFYEEVGVDGVFSDFPDLVVNYLHSCCNASQKLMLSKFAIYFWIF